MVEMAGLEHSAPLKGFIFHYKKITKSLARTPSVAYCRGMSEKRIKVGIEFAHVPAVKSGRGWLGLEKGKTASVRFSKTHGKLQLIEKLANGKERRTLYRVEDYALANETARNANRIGAQSGTGFGALRKEEEAALKIWRAFVHEETAHGKPPRKLDDIMREVVEREREQAETPRFADVAFQFLEYKERRGCWSENVRARHFKQVSALSKSPALTDDDGESKHLSKISIADAETAIEQSVSLRRKGTAISDATRAHWQKALKEIFAWWFDTANADRPQALQLKNPLRSYEVSAVKNLEEPETMSVSDSRKLLSELWEHDISAVPAVAVQMFCGVRNAECARLKWKDLRREASMLYLAKAITKTTQARNVPIPANLAAWLDAYAARVGVPAPDSYIIGANVSETLPQNIKERRRLAIIQHTIERAAKRTGISKPQNAFRHTAISAMCVLHNEFLAAQWAGHDRKIQGEFYKAAMSKQEARDYFGIMPPHSDGKAVAFSREQSERRAAASAPDGTGTDEPAAP